MKDLNSIALSIQIGKVGQEIMRRAIAELKGNQLSTDGINAAFVVCQNYDRDDETLSELVDQFRALIPEDLQSMFDTKVMGNYGKH